MAPRTSLRLARLTAASLVGLAACAGESTAPTSFAAPSSARFALGASTNSTPELGKLKVCKSSSSNVAGEFAISRANVGPSSTGTAVTSANVVPGDCVIVAEDLSPSGSGSNVTIDETSAGFQSVSAMRIDALFTGGTQTGPETFADGGTLFVNQFHGFVVTYVNNVQTPPPPPPPACDFITFGRLVTYVGDDKVVISGNAGGTKPGGGIMGEFHIDANGVDNHVANVDSYGPITSGPLSGPSYPNARMVTGTAKNGVAVELRLWDGGEPGKGTDVVYVTLDGVVTLNAAGQTIDQGNMQYHPVCRGPK
jgi:hypothetical protein